MCKVCIAKSFNYQCCSYTQGMVNRCPSRAEFVVFFTGDNKTVACHAHAMMLVHQLLTHTMPTGDPFQFVGIETIETM